MKPQPAKYEGQIQGPPSPHAVAIFGHYIKGRENVLEFIEGLVEKLMGGRQPGEKV